MRICKYVYCVELYHPLVLMDSFNIEVGVWAYSEEDAYEMVMDIMGRKMFYIPIIEPIELMRKEWEEW